MRTTGTSRQETKNGSQLSMYDTTTKLMVMSSTVLGAICSSWLMGFVAGWKPGSLWYVAWALMPYAVLAVIFLCAYMFRANRSVRRLSAWTGTIIALGGPLLYLDAMFVHVDAQGALVVLMIPVMQTAASVGVALVAGLWQWRIHRRIRVDALRTNETVPTLAQVSSISNKKRFIKGALAFIISIGTLVYASISLLQQADSATIKIARDVDAFIIHHCEANDRLPTTTTLTNQFPALNRDTGWFFYTDDKTFLIIQYPMRWWNKDAIGRRKIFEFTATVYAYTVEYHCKKIK